jgi:AcrR family transcriptional regulator
MDTANSLRGDAKSVDGRTARRLANRERILDAALALVAEGVELDFDDIARSANVSVRSIYNHFPTARHLVAGMYERGTDRMRHFLADLPGPQVPFDQRVRRFVRTWGRMQDELAPIRWQALVAEDKHPDLQPELAILRRAHREQIGRVFPEIQTAKAQAAATALTDSLTWRALRRHQGLGFEAACGVVEEAIRRLVT